MREPETHRRECQVGLKEGAALSSPLFLDRRFSWWESTRCSSGLRRAKAIRARCNKTNSSAVYLGKTSNTCCWLSLGGNFVGGLELKSYRSNLNPGTNSLSLTLTRANTTHSHYAKHNGLDKENLRFYHVDELQPDQTPLSVHLKKDDTIQVLTQLQPKPSLTLPNPP